tara:strand:+ start:64 stop:534 length:471 start_codon:yes stop_codon:yes gene_type:complete
VDENAKMPGVDVPIEERLLFLQENMVNFVKQYNLPVIEVSLVVSKYIRVLLESLERAASESGEKVPENISQAWRIDADLSAPSIESFPLDKLLGTLDEDRMDILDTMMRVIINGAEIPFSSALTLLRDWEMRLRIQMAEATSPGHLFSPMDLPEGF